MDQSPSVELPLPPPFFSECLRFLANTCTDFGDFSKTPSEAEVNRLREAFKAWQQKENPEPFESFLIHPHVVCHFLISYCTKHNPPLISTALGQEMINLCNRSSDDVYRERALLQLFTLLPPISRAVLGSLLRFLYEFCQFHPQLCHIEDFDKDTRVLALFRKWGGIVFCALEPTDSALAILSQATMLLGKAVSIYTTSQSFFQHKTRTLSIANNSNKTRLNSLKALGEIKTEEPMHSDVDSLHLLSNVRTVVLEDTIYIGPVDSSNKPHGTGTLISTDGGYFVGKFDHGKRSGLGTIVGGDDRVMVATYKSDKVNGRVAEVLMSQEEGQKDFDLFTGILNEKGERDGPGVSLQVNSSQSNSLSVASGQWNGSKLNGIANVITDDTFFSGEMDSNGERSGLARVLSSHGIFEGNLSKGIPSGKGSWFGSDGERFYGEFKNGIRDGLGTCQYADGSVYKGSFFEGVFHGQGELTRPNGESYKGLFAKGHRHGNGVFEDVIRGYKYEGSWSGNKKHGEGIEVINGITHKGTWIDGKRTGSFVVTFENIVDLEVELACNFKEGKLSGLGRASSVFGSVKKDASVLYSDLAKGNVPEELYE
ncbi:hypothetical protein P9112_013548 [Eukaryota sp. TZLM1-RC]